MWYPQQVELGADANLVFVFGETSLIKNNDRISEIQKAYPNAHLFGCTTAGEIQGRRVFDNTISITAVQFEHTRLVAASVAMKTVTGAFEAGQKLAASLTAEDLKHVFVLSEGLNINGSDLVKGLTDSLPAGVSITGGLAGDQDRFKETLVIVDGRAAADTISVIGFYGDRLKIRSASLGGWDSFGPQRRMTKSKGNVLYEIDGKSALELYKKYLGEQSKDLPGSALLFPLCISIAGSTDGLVRTVLAINEADQTLTFAGDIPEGSYGRFMKANFDRLIEGAIGAAERSRSQIAKSSPELALLISCVGRKLVLKQRVEEEIEGVRTVFGEKTVLTGFYSYGEISSFTPNAKCELHNQTMTITTFSESDDEAA